MDGPHVSGCKKSSMPLVLFDIEGQTFGLFLPTLDPLTYKLLVKDWFIVKCTDKCCLIT